MAEALSTFSHDQGFLAPKVAEVGSTRTRHPDVKWPHAAGYRGCGCSAGLVPGCSEIMRSLHADNAFFRAQATRQTCPWETKTGYKGASIARYMLLAEAEKVAHLHRSLTATDPAPEEAEGLVEIREYGTHPDPLRPFPLGVEL